ncbi:glycosyltransferase family 2 protein, partial [Candidatus Dojkabacteria bacterium]|nr:glycosyltransferase family 2 protein [Candidatus Dojkabacteria bacterium]
CIPARNETEDSPGCIESVIANKYEKLEILVLDDCSHDKTPEIIKQYAHSGVRFIKGKIPKDDWLPKNSAYDQLADEAKGDVIVFAGVDIRFSTNSVSSLVSQLTNLDMISVLPKRSYDKEGSVFIQPLRYWWELGLWRFNAYSPPVLSSCWAVKRTRLQEIGGFDGLKKAVEPELILAKKFSKLRAYNFLVSSDLLGVESVKSAKDQYATALRTRYIQLQRKPEYVFLTLFFEFMFFIVPYILFFWSLYTQDFLPTIWSLSAIIILSVANAEVYKLALRKLWPIGFISLPFLVIIDWYVMFKSMYGYEFGKITWKDRNICIPLLKVEKELPKA